MIKQNNAWTDGRTWFSEMITIVCATLLQSNCSRLLISIIVLYDDRILNLRQEARHDNGRWTINVWNKSIKMFLFLVDTAFSRSKIMINQYCFTLHSISMNSNLNTYTSDYGSSCFIDCLK